MGIDSQTTERYALSVQEGFVPEPKIKTKIILDRDTVNFYYSIATAPNPEKNSDDKRRRYTTMKTDDLFYKDGLESIRDNFEILTDQLQESLHNVEGGGADWGEVAKNKDGKFWTQDRKDVEMFVALASALEIGEFTTKYVYLRNCSTKERGIFRFVINKEKYQILHPKRKN
jgi:hypothetical protein